jgi:alanyl-tRNA synthetase
MTVKRYLEDSYQTSFIVDVRESDKEGDHYRVLLSDTWFYPESGGQPADRGTIGSARVLDVQLEDDEVVHVLDAEPEAGTRAEIDWQRRFDHMQQHSGQHLLSAAAVALFDAATVGFHLGELTSTVDLDRQKMSQEEMEQLEELCQTWIVANMPVTAQLVTREQFDRMDLRKKNIPDHVSEDIRLVGMGEVDICHCGGTHVRSTAEVQTIKIIASERVRDTTRLHFLAGERAVRDYGLKHDLVIDLSQHFTTGVEDLKQIVLKQQRENKKLSSKLSATQKQLFEYMAREELSEAESTGSGRVLIKHYPDLGGEELRMVAKGISQLDEKLVFAGLCEEDDSATMVCTAGSAYEGDLGAVVKEILPLFNGKGGGRGTYAQAVGEPGHEDEIVEKLRELL